MIQRKTTPLAAALTVSLGLSSAHAGDSYTNAGNALAIGLPLVAAGLTVAFDDAAGLSQLVKSEAVTLGATLALKSMTHETRPNGKDDKSFPSGHSSVAFAAAHFMQLRGGWEYGVPAYLAASVVAASRVHAKEHYTKDVVAGALLGIASSTFFTDRNERYSFGVLVGSKSAQVQYNARW